MEKKELSHIRKFMGKTQEQLAQLLSVSPKAIQSYEQGWRNIPSTIERQMLLYLAVKRSRGMNPPPCWEVKNCPDEWRKHCIVWEFRIKLFCWFMNGTFCEGQSHESWGDKLQICRGCKVYQATFPADLASISDSTN